MNSELIDYQRISSGKSKFWNEYHKFVLKTGIPGNSAKWYVKWITQYANSLDGKPLQECTGKDVKGFLNHFMLRENIETWQVEQARNALRLLYRNYLKVPWTMQKSSSISNINERIPTDKSSWDLSKKIDPDREFLDKAASIEIDASHKEVIEKLKTEIRVRHYSIRTEQAYVN